MADEKRLDETVPGGLYIDGGRIVDAEGRPVEGYRIDKRGTIVPDAPTPATMRPPADGQGT